MKIALLNPAIWLGKNSLHPYVGELILHHKPILYFNDMEYFGAFCYRFQKEYGVAKFLEQIPRFVFGLKTLNDKTDALLCFNGAPEKKLGAPVSGFSGIQIFHVMDYFRNSKEQSEILEKGGVKYVFAYTDHFKHDAFFRKYYPQYKNRVIPVAFSFGERFEDYTPFGERHEKCVAIGSITPFVDKMALETGKLSKIMMGYEAAEFFSPVETIHPDRKMLRDNETKLSDILDSFLPSAKTKNIYAARSEIPDKSWVPKKVSSADMSGKRSNYNIVDVLNQYKMFIHGETVFNVVWAKSFEGCAAGCVLVCSDGEWNREFGFEDKVNCIMHKNGDVDSVRAAIGWGLKNPQKLEKIAISGKELVREKYSPKVVADYIVNRTVEIVEKEKKKI